MWTCHFFNPKRCTYSYISPLNGPKSNWNAFFPRFITKYNEDHKIKLQKFENWKEVDSGIYMPYYIKMFVENHMGDEGYKNSTELRHTLMYDSLQHSNYVTELCLKCGNDNDNDVTSSISWTGCLECKRWIMYSHFSLKNCL